jgi:hypothetical protein
MMQVEILKGLISEHNTPHPEQTSAPITASDLAIGAISMAGQRVKTSAPYAQRFLTMPARWSGPLSA